MTMSYRFVRTFVTAAFLSVVWPNLGFAQLTLVSSSPADGATGVASPATFELVFSAALDTSARFGEPEDFFLNIEVFPEDSVGDPDIVAISEDLKTVTVSGVGLTADTRFVVFLTGAKSRDTGEMLSRPYVVNFTTGSGLPDGSVSGQVTVDGNPATGAVVALFEELFEDDPILLGVASPAYTIRYVPDGTYFPVSVMDSNEDGEVDPAGGDALGVYDGNGDGEPDPIEVLNGGTVADIDLTLTVPVPMTARTSFDEMIGNVQDWASDATLVALNSDELGTDGRSFGWSLTFYSATLDEYQEFFKIGAMVVSEMEEEDHGFGTSPLPESWVDSNAAVTVAETNGGTDFRNDFDHVDVYASLDYFRLYYEDDEMNSSEGETRRSFGFGSTKRMREDQTSPSNIEEISDQLAVWRFHYDSDEGEDYFQVEVNAETGNLLASDAVSNLTASSQAASEWASDAELIKISNRRDVSFDGLSVAWGFLYRSAALDSMLEFIAVSGKVLGKDDMNYGEWPFDALPAQFCNSTEVMALAQEESEDFRAQHPDAYVTAELSMRGHDESNAPTWRIGYHTFSDDHFDVIIDAQTCALPVSVADGDLVPSEFELNQNYPNPFNPTTEIVYRLARSSQVELSVYNVLGQVVRTLVSDNQPSGSYRVRWDGKDSSGKEVPSGIYVYRLQAGEFTESRKMLLLR